MDRKTLKKLLVDIEEIFKDMRREVVASAGTSAISIKDDGSEQTEMDVLVEHKILEMAKSSYPEVPFYGEESGYSLPLPEICCLVDPIDGTKSYIQNIPGYTGMSVIIENGYAIGSIIYDYLEDATYIAIKGEGAFKDGIKLNLAEKDVVKNIYCRERMIEDIKKLEEFSEFTVEKGPTGAGYGFCAVVDSRISARINAPHRPGSGFIHDYAPGALLVLEAGGSIIPFHEDTYSVETMSFVACHPKIENVFISKKSILAEIENQTA
jgi:fructose-1,6-bisphosphatase/inositol monophosphatase family enzyme